MHALHMHELGAALFTFKKMHLRASSREEERERGRKWAIFFSKQDRAGGRKTHRSRSFPIYLQHSTIVRLE